MFAHLKFTAAAAAVAAMGTAAQAQDQTFITIGTGGVTGVYYPTGGAICASSRFSSTVSPGMMRRSSGTRPRPLHAASWLAILCSGW